MVKCGESRRRILSFEASDVSADVSLSRQDVSGTVTKYSASATTGFSGQTTISRSDRSP